MKLKLCAFIGLYLTGSLNVRSQSVNSLRVGITTGLNAANVKTKDVYHNLLWRYNLGITLEKRFSPAVALVSHLLYSRQGFANHAGIAADGSAIIEQTYTLDYLTLPLMLRVRPKQSAFFLEIGGQAGGLLYNHQRYETTPPFDHDIPSTSFWDAGLMGGLGYRLSRHLVTDLRYYHGLLSARQRFLTITDPQSGVVTNYPYIKWYNRVYSLNLSYYF
ncbi:outer membrane beta-barrel protein [Spirosoma sp. HMF4905]|uniref:Outer membrane beta-barrel protein n=1 Tax=Spirosoma arboris TaxID=2682092 RepID=A0A7K1SEW2_9BACT|nr:porin family protein [Spirosoma arboris]MVM32136.1 outer membrane beta-barrel protein [Spirosoma arboris]